MKCELNEHSQSKVLARRSVKYVSVKYSTDITSNLGVYLDNLLPITNPCRDAILAFADVTVCTRSDAVENIGRRDR